MPLHPAIERVTARIAERSRAPARATTSRAWTRRATSGPARRELACGNLAHGFAASGADKPMLRERARRQHRHRHRLQRHALGAPAVGALPDADPHGRAQCRRQRAGRRRRAGDVRRRHPGPRRHGAVAVLARRDRDGHRDLAVARHVRRGAAAGRVRQDRARPADRRAELRPPAGDLRARPGRCPRACRTRRRPRSASATPRARPRRDELLEAEAASYHSPGTCTFYGTANSNQMLMEVMGLHMPGTAFVNPNTPLRDALTVAAAERRCAITALGDDYTPAGRTIDEKAIVNAMVGLAATGGSTNHALHLVAMARAAGILIDWDDLDELSRATPLLARVYPNGCADVNHFQAAGGLGLVIRELLDAGLLHRRHRLRARRRPARSRRPEPWLDDLTLRWRDAAGDSRWTTTCCAASPTPFDSEGGLRCLQGNLGRAVVKISAVAPEHPPHRGAGAHLRIAGCAAGRVQGRRARQHELRRRFRRRGPRPGPARERHARTAQAHADAGRAAGSRPARRPAHRRPHVRRLGQGAGGDPRHPGSRRRRRRSRSCARATSSASMATPARCRRWWMPTTWAAREAMRPIAGGQPRSASAANCSR